MNLTEIAEEIRETLETRKKELELTFFEDEHIYFMRDVDGKYRNDFPSVSKVIKKIYVPFDAESKAHQMTDGDEEETKLYSLPSLSYDIFIVDLPKNPSFLGKKLAVIKIGVFGIFFNI